MTIKIEKENEYVIGFALCYLPIDKSISLAIGFLKYTLSLTIKINSK